jgi:hypothetical protein
MPTIIVVQAVGYDRPEFPGTNCFPNSLTPPRNYECTLFLHITRPLRGPANRFRLLRHLSYQVGLFMPVLHWRRRQTSYSNVQ